MLFPQFVVDAPGRRRQDSILPHYVVESGPEKWVAQKLQTETVKLTRTKSRYLMRIGLTYDLRTWYLERGYTMDETAEFDKEETVVALESELLRLGYETVRIGNIFPAR
jgi:hypothetical protein